MKKLCFIFVFVLISSSLLADSLESIIPPNEGMIEYYFFIDGGWGLQDPYSYDWSKGVDSSGDNYILAKSQNEYMPNYYYFYFLPESELEGEYDYWVKMALSQKKDSDPDTTGSIGDESIFVNLPNTNKKTYPMGDYIGNKVFFMNMQNIPYTKFNLVWESGYGVMDL